MHADGMHTAMWKTCARFASWFILLNKELFLQETFLEPTCVSFFREFLSDLCVLCEADLKQLGQPGFGIASPWKASSVELETFTGIWRQVHQWSLMWKVPRMSRFAL